MERTSILSAGDVIRAGDLPAHIAAGVPVGATPSLPAQQGLAEVERVHILRTLERVGWNHSRAAEVLKIGRTTLWRKLKEYSITR
jgi:transcriptional regulator of acetoin/glycerol metabolism